LIDHLNRGILQLGKITTIVLDEADRMLDMGFREEMETILSALPDERQALFFFATMNSQVERIISRFAQEPKMLQVKQQAKTVSTVDQSYYEVRGRSKIEVISHLLDMDNARLAIVFCNTKRLVEEKMPENAGTSQPSGPQVRPLKKLCFASAVHPSRIIFGSPSGMSSLFLSG